MSVKLKKMQSMTGNISKTLLYRTFIFLLEKYGKAKYIFRTANPSFVDHREIHLFSVIHNSCVKSIQSKKQVS